MRSLILLLIVLGSTFFHHSLSAASFVVSLDLHSAESDFSRTSTLTGSCTDNVSVVLTANGGSRTVNCEEGGFAFDIIFEELGSQDVTLSQQLDSNLELSYRNQINVIEDVDTTAPELILLAPGNQEQVSQSTVLTLQCEPGLEVEYRAGSQDGSFPCVETVQNQEFVFNSLGAVNFYMRQTDLAGNRTLIMTRIRVVEAPVVVPDPEPVGQPQNLSSNGSLQINEVRASRTECTSPCTIMFSLDRMTDELSENPFATTGVHWNYGDDQADENLGRFEHGAEYFRNGRFPDTGASRESDTNTPIGMHTYTCDAGTCSFYPGVAVMNAQGDWATEWLTVTVYAQTETYSETDTFCVSTSGNFSGETACPDGAVQLTELPGPNDWISDARYLLRRGEQFGSSCLPYNRSNITITDFGNGIDAEPELADFGIGHDGTCGDTIPTDATISTYVTEHFIEDITLANLRVANIDIGMSFRDITLDNLDMDFETAAAGGMIATVSADACSNHDDLTCSNIRTPVGFYLSGTTIRGSRNQLPGGNVLMTRASCVSFFGIIDTQTEIAFEHNVRLECGSRVLAIHSDLNGNHLGDRGRKAAMTIRPEGYLNADMLETMYKVDSADGNGARPDNRYIVAKDLYLGTPESVNNSARISFTATNAGQAETTRFGVVASNISDLIGGAGDGPSSRDAALQGVGLVCYSDNDWSPNQGCRDRGQQSIPDGFYAPAIEDLEPPMVPMAPGDY